MSTLVFNLSFLNWSKKGERSLLNARLSLGHCWTDMQAMFDNVVQYSEKVACYYAKQTTNWLVNVIL